MLLLNSKQKCTLNNVNQAKYFISRKYDERRHNLTHKATISKIHSRLKLAQA